MYTIFFFGFGHPWLNGYFFNLTKHEKIPTRHIIIKDKLTITRQIVKKLFLKYYFQ